MQRPPKTMRVGLLGGGQLARMLALKGHELGLEMWVLSSRDLDPAAQVVRHHLAGDPNDALKLKEFLRNIDVATFESEFTNAVTLADCALSCHVSVWPQPSLMGLLQDRLSQKRLLVEHKIPTAPFEEISSIAQATTLILAEKSALVLKKRRFGYDGYGTYVFKKPLNLADIQTLVTHEEHGFIAEPFVPFKRELAVTFVRSRSGDILEFPLVETKQVGSRCFWVKGPVRHPQFAPLSKRLRKMLHAVEYCGAIAFELFDCKGQLLVNEVAPRVHNSTHYSLDACSIDQFSAHLLAISGQDLPKLRLHGRAFAMVNLLGETGEAVQLASPDECHLHWYGKTENRAGRKMGHLNALGSSPEEALKRALKGLKEFRL